MNRIKTLIYSQDLKDDVAENNMLTKDGYVYAFANSFNRMCSFGRKVVKRNKMNEAGELLLKNGKETGVEDEVEVKFKPIDKK